MINDDGTVNSDVTTGDETDTSDDFNRLVDTTDGTALVLVTEGDGIGVERLTTPVDDVTTVNVGVAVEVRNCDKDTNSEVVETGISDVDTRTDGVTWGVDVTT